MNYLKDNFVMNIFENEMNAFDETYFDEEIFDTDFDENYYENKIDYKQLLYTSREHIWRADNTYNVGLEDYM